MQVELSEIDILYDGSGEKYNPRGTVSNTVTMQRHLEEEGQHDPIQVAIGADGRYKLIDGERRCVAARALGWSKIEAVIVEVDLTDENAVREAMLASDVRENYTYSQRGKTLARMQLDQRYPLSRLMVIGGFASIDEVNLVISLASAPESVQKRVDSGELSLTAWRLLRNQPRQVQVQAANGTKTRVRDVRKVIAGAKNPEGQSALPVFDEFLKDDGTTLIQRFSMLRNEIYNSFSGLPMPDAVRLLAIAEDILRLKEQL